MDPIVPARGQITYLIVPLGINLLTGIQPVINSLFSICLCWQILRKGLHLHIIPQKILSNKVLHLNMIIGCFCHHIWKSQQTMIEHGHWRLKDDYVTNLLCDFRHLISKQGGWTNMFSEIPFNSSILLINFIFFLFSFFCRECFIHFPKAVVLAF